MKVLPKAICYAASFFMLAALLLLAFGFYSLNVSIYKNFYLNEGQKTFESNGLTPEQGFASAEALFSYVGGVRDQLNDTDNAENGCLFYETEIVHLSAARKIFEIAGRIKNICFTLSVAGFLSAAYLSSNYMKFLLKAFFWTSVVFAAFIAVFLIFWNVAHFEIYSFFHDAVFKTSVWALASEAGMLSKIVTMPFIKYTVDISIITVCVILTPLMIFAKIIDKYLPVK